MSGLCFALQSKRKFDPKGEHALPLVMMWYDTFHSFLLLSSLVPLPLGLCISTTGLLAVPPSFPFFYK